MSDMDSKDPLEEGDPPALSPRRLRQVLEPSTPPSPGNFYPGKLVAPPPPRPRPDFGNAQTRAAARIMDELESDPRRIYTLIEESSRGWSHEDEEVLFVARYFCDLGPLGSCSIAHTVGPSTRAVQVEQSNFRDPLLGQLKRVQAMRVWLHEGDATTYVNVTSPGTEDRVALASTTMESIDDDCGFGMRAALELAGASFSGRGNSQSEVVEVTWPERDAVVPPVLLMATRLVPLLAEIRS